MEMVLAGGQIGSVRFLLVFAMDEQKENTMGEWMGMKGKGCCGRVAVICDRWILVMTFLGSSLRHW